MQQLINIPRTPDNVQFNIDVLNSLGIPFEVQHGTYTTTIVSPNGKKRYMMNQYNNRVFICAKMIKKDVLNSPFAKEIMEAKYFKTNYGVSTNKKSYLAKKVLNIDITSAYATCLKNNGLITDKTYSYLKSLNKTERLPCVGMLATSHTKFKYENGECVNIDVYRSPTAPVFFYLIDEINYVMQTIEFYLGNKFIFYWVDGVFFDYNTSPKVVKEIEDFLTERGYDYKYEDVQEFKVEVDDTKMMLNMVKNGDVKQYVVGLDSVGESVKQYLHSQAKQQKNQPIINTIK